MDDFYSMSKQELEKKVFVLWKCPDDLEDESNLNKTQFFQVKTQTNLLNNSDYKILSFYNVSQ